MAEGGSGRASTQRPPPPTTVWASKEKVTYLDLKPAGLVVSTGP